jgi:hypothetical protein
MRDSTQGDGARLRVTSPGQLDVPARNRAPFPFLVVCIAGILAANTVLAADAPEAPRIDSLVMIPAQPQAADPAVIWYDDFDGPAKQYTESEGELDAAAAFGGQGRSLLSVYEKGSRGTGNRKVFFGDSPTGKVVNKGKQYDDIYWRVYVKHQYGWTGGGPDKLSRATSMASPKWSQAMIAHVWSSGESLTLDPASGVRGGQVVTTKYNDFSNLHWLGNKPVSQFKIHSTAEAGRWVCVESRAKLNTPGKKDGLNQLWIDGRLEAERTNLDWRGSYAQQGINAVFLEAYWNAGSPVRQCRWIDNFVISTKPIGPVVCPRNPVLIKMPYHGPGKQKAWEAEVAADAGGKSVVWRSRPIAAPDRVTVDATAGQFVGPLAGKRQLDAAGIYFSRVRQQSDAGLWSAWSAWHQPLRTADK